MKTWILVLLLVVTLFSCNGIDKKSMELSIESEKTENAENWDKIFELNNKAIQIDNNNYRAYNNRASARLKLNHEKYLVIQDINKALELKPNYSIAKGNKVVYYFEIEEWENVIELGTDYLNKNENQHIYSLVGESFNNIKNWGEAKKYLSKAIVLDPYDYGAHKERGISNRKLGLYNESISDLNTAIELNPNYHQAYNSRGFTWEKFSEYEKAIKDYSKAITMNPASGPYWYNRGTLYFQLEEIIKGCNDLEMAVRLEHLGAEKELNKNCNK